MPTSGIGQLVKRGVGIETVLWPERDGLLSPAKRLASGYRRYGDTELKRRHFIRRAKALGFSLEDIRSLLALSDEDDVARGVRAAEGKRVDIGQRIAGLERIRAGPRTLVTAGPGHGCAEDCPILNALTQQESR